MLTPYIKIETFSSEMEAMCISICELASPGLLTVRVSK